jgi:hypothetical protein
MAQYGADDRARLIGHGIRHRDVRGTRRRFLQRGDDAHALVDDRRHQLAPSTWKFFVGDAVADPPAGRINQDDFDDRWPLQQRVEQRLDAGGVQRLESRVLREVAAHTVETGELAFN